MPFQNLKQFENLIKHYFETTAEFSTSKFFKESILRLQWYEFSFLKHPMQNWNNSNPRKIEIVHFNRATILFKKPNECCVKDGQNAIVIGKMLKHYFKVTAGYSTREFFEESMLAAVPFTFYANHTYYHFWNMFYKIWPTEIRKKIVINISTFHPSYNSTKELMSCVKESQTATLTQDIMCKLR